MRFKVIASVLVAFVLSTTVLAQAPATAPKKDEPGATPEMFWQALMLGNRQFVAGTLTYDKLAEERRLLADNQYPPMTILSCSDSRVPPELVFNQSLGSLFIVRSAGNYADTLGLASIEYAISNNWTMLLVVLAHEDCGAVKASLGKGDPASPNLLALATRIRESFYGIDWDPNNKETVRKATIANAKHAATALIAQSSIVRQAVADGRVKVVVAYYSTSTGVVQKVE